MNSGINNTSVPYTLAMPREFVLDNGLRVVTLSTPTLKSTGISITFDTGSRDDPEGEEGTAHFLEHMMFNGTDGFEDIPKKMEVEKQARLWGGKFSASTSWNKTQYSFEDILNCETLRGESREYFADALDLIFRIVQHPLISQEDIANECSIIQAERAMLEDPMREAIIYSNLQSSAPNVRPIPIIGTEESINRIDAEKLRHFFKENYTPENATIFVQGQASDEEIFKMVTDRLTALASSHDKQASPSNRFPEFIPGESRIAVEKSQNAVYILNWDVASAQKGRMNLYEELAATFMCSIISQYLLEHMRDKDALVYHAGCHISEFGNVQIQIYSDKEPQKVLQSFSNAMQDFMQKPNDKLEKIFNETKLESFNASLHEMDKIDPLRNIVFGMNPAL